MRLPFQAVMVAVVLGFSSCVTTAPATGPAAGSTDEGLLRLAPSTLGRELHLAQRVTFHRGATTMAFDAQLEADATALRLAAFALGQTVAKLTWDGVHLEETHSQHVPEVVTPARIMSDVQLAFWPEAAVRAGLTPRFSLEVGPARRMLLKDGQPFIDVRYTGEAAVPSKVELDHVQHGFQMVIESTEAE